ncbi:hypothetical protein [Desulfobacter curvatus]|uniref:hypothetical protein n=1 Tax=Desulfobacter curvatus TaxID=2290 RepID=UPI00035E09A9|nr:hypothetical protein [Desulfobacter curvatus]
MDKKDEFYDRLRSWYFLSVCYQQRMLRNDNVASLKKVTKAIEDIYRIIDEYFKTAQDDIKLRFHDSDESFDFFKRLIFSISIYGTDSKDFFEKYTPRHDMIEGIKDLIFSEHKDELNLIQKISLAYGEFDAYSLTTFEDIDFYIDELLELKSSNETSLIREDGSSLFPKCYHLFMAREFEFEYDNRNLDTTKDLVLKINPCDSEFNIDSFIYRTLRTIKAYQSQGSDLLKRMAAEIGTPATNRFIETYWRLPDKLSANDLFGRFVGLKIWDLKVEHALSRDAAINCFTDWYNDKYPYQEDEIPYDSLTRYYRVAKHAIEDNDYCRLQREKREREHEKKVVYSRPPKFSFIMKKE